MKNVIAKDKSGFTGELIGRVLIDLFTGEAKDVLAEDVTEIGYIEKPKHLNSLDGNLFKQQMMGTPVAPFYMLGNVSARQKLRYVRMNNTVLMGFSDHYATGNGNIYFFRQCGTIGDVPVYTYMSDMVIKEEKIMWIHAGEHTHVPNE